MAIQDNIAGFQGMGGIWNSLTGGVLGSGGQVLGMGISKLMGMDGSSMSSSANNAVADLQEKTLQNDIKYQQARNLASMTNQAGLTGNAAALDAQRALDEKNGPSADAIFNSNNMVNNAQSGIGAAFSQGNLARIGAAQQSGNMIDAIRNGNAGGSVAALGAINNANRQMGQNLIGATATANESISKANQNLTNAFGQSQGLLDNSRNTQFQTQVSPHLTNVNATNNTSSAATSGGSGTASSIGGGTGAITNPLSGIATNFMAFGGQEAGLGGQAAGMGNGYLAGNTQQLKNLTPEQWASLWKAIGKGE